MSSNPQLVNKQAVVSEDASTTLSEVGDLSYFLLVSFLRGSIVVTHSIARSLTRSHSQSVTDSLTHSLTH